MAGVAKASLDALAESSERSQKATRAALELAFARLRHGNPRVVPKGTSITPTAVAKEAGVRRETLYRFHEPVLTQIRTHNDKQPRDQLRHQRSELKNALAAAKELRKLAEDAQRAEEALARINHRLAGRVAELERLLKLRDEALDELRIEGKTARGNVLPLKPRKA